jgi:hypothetical protein
MLKTPRFVLVAVLAGAFQLGTAALASAHGVGLTATSVCNAATGTAVIQFTAFSWSNNHPEGSNPLIEIRFNGVLVATGSFGPGQFSFSGTLPAPAGATATVSAVAAATWGDGLAGGQITSVTVSIPSGCVEQEGRFTGGGRQILASDVSVTRGLTIHCDLVLSNNLEINWSGGNHFHMEEHLVTIACIDSPNIDQTPPVAPLDTLIGTGIGKYNNADGYSIQFTLVDAGEPGTEDQMAIRIFETANPANVVLNVPLQFLTGGNLQAHADQPHK